MRTRIVLLCCCVVSYLYSIAQPPNNACGSAVSITTLDGSCITGDVTGATADIASFGCTAGSNENVWFSFVAQGVSAEIQVNNGPGVPEITLIQFTGGPCNPAGALELECIAGTTLTVDNELVVGSLYYVMVAFSNNADGTFDICVDNPPPAPNDACVTATPINTLDNACIDGNNDWPATDVLIPGCFAGSTWNVWYSFVAQGVSLDVYVPTGGPGIAQVAVIDFVTNCNPTGAVVLGCATGTNHIVLDNQLTIGGLYYIVVGFQNSDWQGNGIGDFELCIDNPVPAVNDDCSDAIVIPTSVLNDPTTCFTSIAGNPLNNDWPSTDVGLFSCWNSDDSYNIWYSFVAQGPDVQITVEPTFAQDAQIALVQFTGTPCEFAGAQQLECAYGTVLDFNDQLVIGNTYYIAVGFEDNAVGPFCMNVFNPQPPPNDQPCNAITLQTNNNCEDGTTVYANPETLFWPPNCPSTNVVWYEIQLADPDNVGFIIDLALEDINPSTEVGVFLYPGTDCNNIPNPTYFYCGDPPTEPIEFGPVENIPYLLAIGTTEPNETDFEVCVDEIPPCFDNDICDEATVISGVTSDAPFVCVTGCNLFADPETFNNACNVGDFSTVWFQVPTDGNAALMNIFVTSEDFEAPTISLFWQTTDCSALTPVPMGGGNAPCIVGSGGEAQAIGSDVGANAIYYIAVSSLNDVGGEFELCVNTISAASLCVTSRDIEITARSSGGPLEGPFFPGETVSVCLNVNSYTAANNGCQWFQGIIPVFGNGWDPSSFDAGTGQPNLNATVNGNNFGVPSNGVYGASTWDWFTDVDYHYDHFFYQLGDFDGNGTTDMCNLLYDPDCPNTGGLMGGCCNPCWGNPLGTILPGGWFAYGINGSCPTPGPPIRVDWGDGNTCGGGMGPWAFCFDLVVRDYPDCLEDPTTMDLKIGFFTTADGETGAWTGNASICALDQPAFVTLPMCCSELAEGFDILDPICSEQQFVYSIHEDGVDFWEWTVDGDGTTGGLPGEGGPGTVIINTLTNNTGDVSTVTYTFLGFAGGACPVFEKEVTIDVYPKIEATFDPIVMCATPNNPYTIGPNVTGGTGNYEFLWNPGNESTPSITIPNPINGTTYTVSITDEAGCFTTASIALNVYSTFPVDIIAPVVEQCIQDGPITIEATANGGIDPYAFEWTLPGGSNVTTEEVITSESGQHLVVVTDDEGCVGKDSIIITLNETPEVTINAVGGILALCENQSTQLTGVATGGESPYIYEWDTPDGPESGTTITAYNPGIFTVTVEDANGCTNSFDIGIEAQEEPEPDLGPDILVCNFDETVELTLTEQYEDYAWSVGSAADGLESIGVYITGTYTVTVTNEYGCTASDDVDVDTFPAPAFALPDTFEICPGACVTINADDYGGPWEYAQWDQCPGCFLEFDVCVPGDYQVAVFDINECSTEQEFAVVVTASIATGLTGDTVLCVSSGESTTLSANTGFSSYEWSPAGNQNTNSISVNAPGTYAVTVEDDLGCIGIDSLEVVSGDFNASITGPAAICANVLATITALPAGEAYVWSNGDITQMISVDDGTHTVTVTNSDGCTATASTTIIETPFVPVITGDNIICQTSDSTVLDAGPGQSFTWSPGGATSQTITVYTGGDYFVTVTDVSGCVGSTSFSVANHQVPFVAVTGNPDFCVGGDTEMAATGGYVNYNWSNSSSNDTIVINTPGNYTVTITDSNGCTNTASATVNNPYQENVDITGSFVFCPGGQATLAVPAGYASVDWSTGETTDQIFVTTDGVVSVIVVDGDGCIAYDTVTTQANSVLSPNIIGPNLICDAGPGMLDAGPGFDSYAWCCGLGNNQTAAVTAAGTYTVTVTDGSCTGTDDFVVAVTNSPYANVTNTASACNVQEPGGPTTIISFDGLVTGGDLNGDWSQTGGPGTVNLGNTNAVDFDGLAPGTYTFTYSTNSAVAPCVDQSYSLTVTILDCSCAPVQLGLSPDLCNDLGSIDLFTLLAGGTQNNGGWVVINEPPGSNPAVLNGSIFDASNADPGTYTLEYTVPGLPAYCDDNATVNINVLNNPTAGVASTPLQYCVGENDVINLLTMLTGADSGGEWVETSQYMSTGGAFNPVAGTFNTAGQAAGKYTFAYIIAGPGPCPDDMTTVEITIETNPVADAGATATLNCNVTSTTLGGAGSSVGTDINYMWVASNGGTVQNPDQLYATATSAGTYTLTVINTLTGCTSTDVVIIDQIGDFPTDLELTVLSPDCEGDPPGSAQVTDVIGGVEPYTYVLNGGAPTNNPNFQDLDPGDYTLLVTDATGCEIETEFTVYDLVNVDLNIINYVNDTLIFDFKDTITLSYEYIGSTTIPDSLVWKSADTVMCIDCAVLEFPANLSGTITVEAYDVRGCFVTKSINYIVVRKRDVYIPNVFSPNGDQLNDYFTLFTDSDVQEISKMEIYTRWGELVFSEGPMPPNDPSLGWDGTFRGQTLNPGVYVYRIDILYGDGLKDQLVGDITIVK